MSRNLEIQLAHVVLDENMNVVDWFDTLEEAEAFVEQEEEDNE